MTEMETEALTVVEAGAQGKKIKQERVAFMRYAGQGHEIVVPLPLGEFAEKDAEVLQMSFDTEYKKLYGRILPNADVEILTWALTAMTENLPPDRIKEVSKVFCVEPLKMRSVFDSLSGKKINVPLFWRPDLSPGVEIKGPALIAEDATSSFVPPTFDASIMSNNYIFLNRKVEDNHE